MPAIIDRDPGWPAAHPEVMQSLARSRWFVSTCHAWTVLSIGVLLALRLGVGRAGVLGGARSAGVAGPQGLRTAR